MSDECWTTPPVRPPTGAELRALGHPTRLRIVRLCRDTALTNQELAARLKLAPATVLRHVRALAQAGFLAAEPVRTGARGALEKPYRATDLSLRLAWDAAAAPGLLQQVEIALLHAYRTELIEAGPAAIRDQIRGTLRLPAPARQEFQRRLRALLDEFTVDTDDPAAEPLSFLWMLHAAPPG
ncbi:MAG TPA: winged helix-turn-helix domain-containing protein [Mycobacteriales bacterium]|nr:winged helix-turn-helix domain-containing protein [Mycobacteriales bacterium]